MGDFSATITSIGTLVAAIGALITASGAAWLALRNSRRAEEARSRAAADVQIAKDAADAAAIKAAIAAEAAADAKQAIVKVGDDVFLVGKAIDGRLSELLALTRTSALAEGRLAAEEETRVARDAALERTKPEGGP